MAQWPFSDPKHVGSAFFNIIHVLNMWVFFWLRRSSPQHLTDSPHVRCLSVVSKPNNCQSRWQAANFLLWLKPLYLRLIREQGGEGSANYKKKKFAFSWIIRCHSYQEKQKPCNTTLPRRGPALMKRRDGFVISTSPGTLFHTRSLIWTALSSWAELVTLGSTSDTVITSSASVKPQFTHLFFCTRSADYIEVSC